MKTSSRISYPDRAEGTLVHFPINARTTLVANTGNQLCNSGNTATTADTALYTGGWTSITIGADGLGLIVYYDHQNIYLEVLHCGNQLCSNGNTTTAVDADNWLGFGGVPSIHIGADGLGLVSYYDSANDYLNVLHCGNLGCNSNNTTTTVDTAGDVGIYSSITIGLDGLGLIAYYDQSNVDLKVLHCGNLLCNRYNFISAVNAPGQDGQFASIATGSDGLGLICYYDYATNTLNVTKLAGLCRR